MNRDFKDRKFRDRDRRDNRDSRDNRDNRYSRDNRDSRDNRYNRDSRDNRYSRDSRDNRDNHEREELYSQQVSAGKRKYFFDVKATKGGDKYVAISESRKMFDNDSGAFYFDRNRVFIYKEDIEKFRAAFDNALHFIETGEKVEVPSEEYNHYSDEIDEQDVDHNRYDEKRDAFGGDHYDDTMRTASSNASFPEDEFSGFSSDDEDENRSMDKPMDNLDDIHINEI